MALLSLCALAAGCSGPADALVPAELTLRPGEEAVVPGTIVGVTFVRVVEDSRCPIDEFVVCVWEGNARLEVGARAGTGPTALLELNSTLEPRTASWAGVQLSIVALRPYPSADGTPVPPGDYVLTLRVAPER